MSYHFVRVSQSQLPVIARLAEVIYGYAPEPTALLRKFSTNAFGAEYIGYLAYPIDEQNRPAVHGEAAAYYGVFPTRARIGGEMILCAQSGDTMTHPDHRGKGLFVDLARKTYELARTEGIKFVFGFPNENSYPGFAKKLEWLFPYTMRRWVRYVPTIPTGLIARRLGRNSASLPTLGRLVLNQMFKRLRPDELQQLSGESAFAQIVHDRLFWSSKGPETILAEFEKTQIALKFDGDLVVGSIQGAVTPHNILRLMRRLDLIAMASGAIRLKSYFSPQSRLHSLLDSFGRTTESLPFGYRSLDFGNVPSKMVFEYADYDTF